MENSFDSVLSKLSELSIKNPVAYQQFVESQAQQIKKDEEERKLNTFIPNFSPYTIVSSIKQRNNKPFSSWSLNPAIQAVGEMNECIDILTIHLCEYDTVPPPVFDTKDENDILYKYPLKDLSVPFTIGKLTQAPCMKERRLQMYYKSLKKHIALKQEVVTHSGTGDITEDGNVKDNYTIISDRSCTDELGSDGLSLPDLPMPQDLVDYLNGTASLASLASLGEEEVEGVVEPHVCEREIAYPLERLYTYRGEVDVDPGVDKFIRKTVGRTKVSLGVPVKPPCLSISHTHPDPVVNVQVNRWFCDVVVHPSVAQFICGNTRISTDAPCHSTNANNTNINNTNTNSCPTNIPTDSSTNNSVNNFVKNQTISCNLMKDLECSSDLIARENRLLLVDTFMTYIKTEHDISYVGYELLNHHVDMGVRSVFYTQHGLFVVQKEGEEEREEGEVGEDTDASDNKAEDGQNQIDDICVLRDRDRDGSILRRVISDDSLDSSELIRVPSQSSLEDHFEHSCLEDHSKHSEHVLRLPSQSHDRNSIGDILLPFPLSGDGDGDGDIDIDRGHLNNTLMNENYKEGISDGNHDGVSHIVIVPQTQHKLHPGIRLVDSTSSSGIRLVDSCCETELESPTHMASTPTSPTHITFTPISPIKPRPITSITPTPTSPTPASPTPASLTPASPILSPIISPTPSSPVIPSTSIIQSSETTDKMPPNSTDPLLVPSVVLKTRTLSTFLCDGHTMENAHLVELVFSLPLESSPSLIEAKVFSSVVTLQSPHYSSRVELPYPINTKFYKAKWSKKLKTFKLTLVKS